MRYYAATTILPEIGGPRTRPPVASPREPNNGAPYGHLTKPDVRAKFLRTLSNFAAHLNIGSDRRYCGPKEGTQFVILPILRRMHADYTVRPQKLEERALCFLRF